MQHMLPTTAFQQNAKIYKAMANPARLHILNYIRHREATVTELTKVLKLRKANVSQHLSILRLLGLVRIRRNGLNVFYRITDPRIVEPCHILHHLQKERAFV